MQAKTLSFTPKKINKNISKLWSIQRQILNISGKYTTNLEIALSTLIAAISKGDNTAPSKLYSEVYKTRGHITYPDENIFLWSIELLLCHLDWNKVRRIEKEIYSTCGHITTPDNQLALQAIKFILAKEDWNKMKEAASTVYKKTGSLHTPNIDLLARELALIASNNDWQLRTEILQKIANGAPTYSNVYILNIYATAALILINNSLLP